LGLKGRFQRFGWNGIGLGAQKGSTLLAYWKEGLETYWEEWLFPYLLERLVTGIFHLNPKERENKLEYWNFWAKGETFGKNPRA